MVDNASIAVITELNKNHIITHATTFFKNEFLESEKNKIFIRNIKKRKYEYINFLSISDFRGKTKIIISFSYSRFFNKDNFKICDDEKKINEVHRHIIQLLQVLTGTPIIYKYIKLVSLDICNQIQTNFKDKYNTINLLARIIGDEQTTLYFSIDENSKKVLQGFSVFENRKAKKEQKTFFKMYNKARERLDTNKFTAGQTETIRAELTLKEQQLKYLKITSIEAIKKNVLDDVIKKVLGDTIKKKLKDYLFKDINKLIEIVNKKPFNKLEFLKYEYLIFDTEFLKYIFNNSDMAERTAFYHKKNILEQLEDLEKKGEIVKKYSGNIKDLEKILKELFKIKVKIKATSKGIDILWQE